MTSKYQEIMTAIVEQIEYKKKKNSTMNLKY